MIFKLQGRAFLSCILFFSKTVGAVFGESHREEKSFPNYEELEKITNLSKADIDYYLYCIQKNQDYVVNESANRFFYWAGYYHILPNLIKKYDLKVGCEIGVAFGTHSAAILEKTPITKLYSIDPYILICPAQWGGCLYYPNINGQTYSELLYAKVKHLLSSFGDRSTLMRTTSAEASKSFEINSLDFIYIDAEHTYEEVSADLNAWYDKIKTGGIISGDDYTDHFPGVIQAVNEFFGKRNIPVHQDEDYPRFWWTQKP